MGILYLVSTPIGNLEDITIRAKDVLGKVDLILAEDTRKTSQMLRMLNVSFKKLISYYEENEFKRIPEVITYLKEGKDVCLVSNAGTPIISDPGYKLVKQAISEGIKISPIPGASALLSALVISGFPVNHFLFLGFLPKKESKKRKLFEKIIKADSKFLPTVVFYESPIRLLKTLELVAVVFGDLKLTVCREMTKKFEEIFFGNISEILVKLKDKGVKGEITVVFSRLK